MRKFKVKFFGAKEERREQVKQIKTIIEAESVEAVERQLRYRYSVVNGLKIREIKDEEK